MFTSKYKVRMSDSDMAGILFFANQYHFIHYTIEDFFEKIGLPFDKLFNENPFVFVIVHSEADYLHPLSVGDLLTIEMSIKRIGTSSLHFHFDIKRGSQLVGRAETIHVCLDRHTRSKIPIPDSFRQKLLEL